MSNTAGDPFTCFACGKLSFRDESGVSHHESATHPNGVDYDADRDHVAFNETGGMFDHPMAPAVAMILYERIGEHLGHDFDVNQNGVAPAIACVTCERIVFDAADHSSVAAEALAPIIVDRVAGHGGHDIKAVTYADGANLAIECLTCYEVILDADAPDTDDDDDQGDDGPQGDVQPPTVGFPRLPHAIPPLPQRDTLHESPEFALHR